MPMQGGSECPNCGERIETEDGLEYVCTGCGKRFDSADVFLP